MSFLNAFLKLANAKGESRQTGFEGWIEIQGWEWGVKAETSWTQGGGASVGKPSPGELSFEHYYDRSSPVIMAYICSGRSFDEVEIQMCKSTGANSRDWFYRMVMKDAFLTSVMNSATDDGNVLQKVEMVFKDVSIDYKPQMDSKSASGTVKPGSFGAAINYQWNIPAGTSSGGG